MVYIRDICGVRELKEDSFTYATLAAIPVVESASYALESIDSLFAARPPSLTFPLHLCVDYDGPPHAERILQITSIIRLLTIYKISKDSAQH